MNDPIDPNSLPKDKKTKPDTRVAKIRCLDQLKAKGFTFAKGKVVEGVPMAHAEYLVSQKKAEIVEVS